MCRSCLPACLWLLGVAAGGPYRHQEQLMYARVPAEYVTTTGGEMR